MSTMERRIEILNILIARRHTTMRELSEELGVTHRTIRRDIEELSLMYPIYTQQGVHGGVFMENSYTPNTNTLTPDELDTLKKICAESKGDDAKILLQILKKYGPNGGGIH